MIEIDWNSFSGAMIRNFKSSSSSNYRYKLVSRSSVSMVAYGLPSLESSCRVSLSTYIVLIA